MKKIIVGNIVQLKSGGPKMTISTILENNKILCVWFKNNKLKSAIFETNTLNEIEVE